VELADTCARSLSRSGHGREGGIEMSARAKIAVGGVVVGLLLIPLLGFWLSLLVVLGIPAVAYLMLDPSQRRRLRRISRKEIGR
jgi:membrane protein implicated in regulation of membrane protease activity